MSGHGPEQPFQHELVLHAGTEALVDLMVPFVRDGAAAGERILLVGEPEFVGGLLAAVGEVDGIQALPESGRERFAGRDLHRFHQVLSTLDAEDQPVRVVNQMPTMTPQQWYEWRRYEAAVNTALSPFRVRGTCAYDTDGLDDAMLEDLTASHPQVQTADGVRPSERFADLDEHVRTWLDVPPHPVESTPPELSMDDPSAAAARRAVRGLATAIGLPPTAVKAAVLATSETVTNGSLHGRAPVSLRAWTDGGRLTVAVSDAGQGPHPLVGLQPVPTSDASGRGMWILHQLLGELQHRTHADGYTVLFSVGPEGTVHP